MKNGIKTSEFWVTIITGVITAGVTVANSIWNLGLNAGDIMTAIAPFLAYIGGRSVAKIAAK